MNESVPIFYIGHSIVGCPFQFNFKRSFLYNSNIGNSKKGTQDELTRIRNRLARWFAIYFPEYKDVYRDLKAVSRRMVLKEAPLPEDIMKLGAEGVNQLWRRAKLRGAGMKRAKTLVSAAERSVGSKEAAETARMELKNLLDDIRRPQA